MFKILSATAVATVALLSVAGCSGDTFDTSQAAADASGVCQTTEPQRRALFNMEGTGCVTKDGDDLSFIIVDTADKDAWFATGNNFGNSYLVGESWAVVVSGVDTSNLEAVQEELGGDIWKGKPL